MTEPPERAVGVEDVSMDGRTVLVTGSTGGIGRATALALGRLGATVVVHGRSEQRGREVVETLGAVGTDAVFLPADFASLSAVAELADRVHEWTGTVDVLVNNAGDAMPEGGTTEDGVALTFGVNHLAPYLLTRRLLSAMPDDGRVVTVSSAAHRAGEIDFDALREADEGGFGPYADSKLANVLFTRELARRLRRRGSGITANCLHPGVAPESWPNRTLFAPVRALARVTNSIPGLEGRAFDTVGSAAQTPVYLAASPAVSDVSGKYFANCHPKRPSRGARDDRTARRLWTVSADLAGIDPELSLDG